MFYELGLAHAAGKSVILITSDPINEAPSDVRHFEFIQYRLDDHVSFLARLDNAIDHVSKERYVELFNHAIDTLDRVRRDWRLPLTAVPLDEFVRRAKDAEANRSIPSITDQAAIAEFVLPLVVRDNTALKILAVLEEWIAQLR